MKLLVFILCIGLIAAGAAGLYYAHGMDTDTAPTPSSIRIGTTTIAVEVADTEAAREAGLSGRASLPEGNGMLFVFDEDSQRGIWMKDMQFPIDIVFISAAGEVVSVAADVSPDTYPQTFYPPRPVRYVLELSAGFAGKHGIAEGAKIVL